MIIDIEPVLSALFTLLQQTLIVNFTAQGTSGSPTLTNVSSVNNFFIGLPVFGPGVQKNCTILSFDATAMTATLDMNLTKDAAALSAFRTGFQTASRRVKDWAEVPSQPALFLRHLNEEDDYLNSVMQRTIIEAEIWVYSKAGSNPDAAPDVTLNNIVKAIRSALKMGVNGRPQTLGGLVQWCRIEGTTKYDPGDLDDQSKALIPIKILCP